MKEEALKLADESQRQSSLVYLVADEPVAKQMSQMFLNYSAMIRRLVEELDKQEHCCPDCGCHFVGEYPFNNAPQTKPLSNEEIWDIWNKNGIGVPYEFARAIEERHGIK